MRWLILLTTLPCFVEYDILAIGHLWQHHWMMIWMWSAIGAIGGGMLVNPSKTRLMHISHSRTVEPLFPDLVVAGSVVEMVSELKILGVILDSKLTFEKQVRAIAASALRRVSIWRRQWVFLEMSLLLPNAFGHSYSLC